MNRIKSILLYYIMADTSVDLNIEHYTIIELMDLFDIEEPLTKEKIQNILTSHIGNQNESYTSFYQQAQEKLETYLEEGTEDGEPEEDTKDTLGLLTPMPDSDAIYEADHYVIKHSNLSTKAMYNQEQIAGLMNPIKRRVIKKVLLVNTKFRDNYDETESTNLTIQLPTVIKNVISMKLSTFEFPITNYIFSQSLQTNIFTIIYNGTEYLITIPEGNYSSFELAAEVNIQFLAAPVAAEVSFDSKYGKFIINFSAGAIGGNTLDLDFRVPDDLNRNIMHNIGWIMGYRQSQYTGAVCLGSAALEVAYTPEGIFDSGGTRYIYLVVNDFNNNVNDFFVGAFENYITTSDILARISQPSTMSDIIFDDNSDYILKKRNYFGPVNIERLHIQVLDEFGRIIDINHMDYSLSLELECVYNL